MGLFGPSEAEIKLQNQLDETRGDLSQTQDRLTMAENTAASLLKTADGDAETIRDLRQEVADNKIGNSIGEYAVKVLEQMREAGEIDFAVEATAQEVVTKRTIEQVTASLVNDLIDTEYARLVAQIDPDLETIREQQRERLIYDGTFENLKGKVRQEARTKAIEDELTAAREAAEAEWNTPDAVAKLRAEIEADADFMQKIEKIMAEARKKALRAQRDKFEADAPGIAEAEVAAGEPAARKKFMEEWPNTYDGADKIAKLKRKLENQVANEGKEEILAQTTDATLLELRAKREAQIKQKLEAEVLLDDFMNAGIDTNSIPAGSRFTVYLGDTKQTDDFYYDKAYDGNKHGAITTVITKRLLELTSQGGGKFTLNSDSLAESTSVYERSVAIPVGTVLTLGRQQIERDMKTLDNKVVHGVPLFYDTDDTDTAITSTELKVQMVKLGGIVAAHESVKKVTDTYGTTENLYKR